MHPTGGTLRVFKQVSWLEIGSIKVALSRPAHQRVTQAVGRTRAKVCQTENLKRWKVDYSVIEKDNLVKTLHVPLKTAGFKKRSLSWYLNGKDTIVVVNLQRSDWSKLYYINIGIWLKALGDELFPKHYKCHMYWRVERLYPNERELIITSCDLEKSNPDLLNRLQVFFESNLVPFLLECGDEGKIKSQILDGSIINMELLHRVEPRYYFFGINELD